MFELFQYLFFVFNLILLFVFAKAFSNLGERVYLDFTHELSINKIGHLKKHQCTPETNLHYDKIFYKEIAIENQKKFGCSVPFHPPIQLESDNKDVKICDNATVGKSALENWSDAKSGSLVGNDQSPCAWFDIFLGLPVIDDDGNDPTEAYIRVYIKSKIKVKSIVIYYDSTTFAAEIGGYVGMFLGVSLVDIAILVNSGFLKLVRTNI